MATHPGALLEELGSMDQAQLRNRTVNALSRNARVQSAPAKKKGHGLPHPFFDTGNYPAYAICSSAPSRRRRRMAKPIAPKPSSIIAQVPGSGTAVATES